MRGQPSPQALNKERYPRISILSAMPMHLQGQLTDCRAELIIADIATAQPTFACESCATMHHTVVMDDGQRPLLQRNLEFHLRIGNDGREFAICANESQRTGTMSRQCTKVSRRIDGMPKRTQTAWIFGRCTTELGALGCLDGTHSSRKSGKHLVEKGERA